MVDETIKGALKARDGFTLVELMVVVALLAILGGMVAYMAVVMQKSLDRERGITEVQLNISRAMDDIDRNLRRAGFGIDPRFTFDLDINNDGVVDSDGGPSGTDELRFVYREPDPRYYWQVLDASCSSLVLYADATTNPINLPVGSILFIISSVRNNKREGTFVRVSQAVTNGSGTVTVSLYGTTVMDYNFCGGNIDGNSPLPVSIPTADDPVFDDRRAVAMLVRYFRYYIGKAPSGITSLILDPGVDMDGDGVFGPASSADHIVVAEGIEDLQVEYLLATHLWNATDINTVGPPLYSSSTADTFGSLTTSFPVPDKINAPYNDPDRMLLHPANIRKVIVRLVGYSERNLGVSSPRPALSNHTEPAGDIPNTLLTNDNFFRITISDEVVVRNMLTTKLFRRIPLSVE